MNQINLKKYSFMYKSLERCGVSKIINNYLDLPEDTLIPLSLSHGVDMGHCFCAMDTHQPEPIHWAYNDSIYRRSSKVKKSLKIPHPWSMIVESKKISKGKGSLIIAPPPGELNDNNLWEYLKSKNYGELSILLKLRNVDKSKRSLDFWEKKGIKVVTAGEQDAQFYNRLFNILNDYENVIAPTVSSAVFFASSIGKKVKFISGYSYYSFDVLNYEKFVNLHSKYTRSLISNFLKSSDSERSVLSREILGFNYLNDREVIKAELQKAIKELKTPVYTENGKLVMLVKLFICRVTKQSAFIRKGTFKVVLNYLIKLIKKDTLVIKETSELDLWVQGCNLNNFKYIVPDKKMLEFYKSSLPGDGL